MHLIVKWIYSIELTLKYRAYMHMYNCTLYMYVEDVNMKRISRIDLNGELCNKIVY